MIYVYTPNMVCPYSWSGKVGMAKTLNWSSLQSTHHNETWCNVTQPLSNVSDCSAEAESSSDFLASLPSKRNLTRDRTHLHKPNSGTIYTSKKSIRKRYCEVEESKIPSDLLCMITCYNGPGSMCKFKGCNYVWKNESQGCDTLLFVQYSHS